jgi:acyl-CoA reductase-like NAD-dependent aldehyde dehydrogenase
VEPISVADLDALCRRLPSPDPKRARAVMPQVARRWLDPEDPFRVRALDEIGKSTGYAPGMIAQGLTHILGEIAEHLTAWVERDLPSGWVERPNLRSRWIPPRLTLCIFAGNVPGVPAPDIAGALAAGSAVLCKVAHNEPCFGPIFIDSIAAVDPELAASACAVYWPGSSTEHLDTALRHAEAVVAYGSDDSVASVRNRVKPGTPFLGYGHRLSFAVVDAGVEPDAAARVAFDVANFDQQGCVSPHVVYVRGDGRAFSKAMAEQLAKLQEVHPRAKVTMEEAAAIRRVRDEVEFKEGAELFASRDTSWTVIYDEVDRAFRPSPLGRTVRVHSIASFEELPPLLRGVRHYLQTCSFSGRSEDAERLAETLGITRVCAAGRVQQTRITWHHDGQLKLSRLVRWVDVEEGVGT